MSRVAGGAARVWSHVRFLFIIPFIVLYVQGVKGK